MSNNQIYYNMDNIDSKNCIYNIIFGEKSNGKSYQVKLKKGIKKYLETGRRFILMRRWDTDMKNNWVESYFQNLDIEELTKGKYNVAIKYKNEILLAKRTINENGEIKTKKGERMGYAIPISMEQHYSSADFTDCDDIIVEEFMERGVYVAREPEKFSAFYSTVDRKRGTTRVWFIGNTITKANPYIFEWGLQPIVRKMKQGDIEVVNLKNENGTEIQVALEYCRSSGGKSMTLGATSSMIDSGAWQSTPQPHLPKSKKEYDVLFRCLFQYQGFTFNCEYLKDKKENLFCWFIFPKYDKIRKNTLVFSDIIKLDDFWQRNIYDLSFKNKNLSNLFDTFREGNIFFSDDLCGTDFKQVIDFTIRK